MVIIQQSAQTLTTLYRSSRILRRHRNDQPVSERLMVSLRMIMGNEFINGLPQCIFTKEDHPLQTAFLNRAHESFRVGGNWAIAAAVSPIRYPVPLACSKILSCTTDRDHGSDSASL